MIEIGYLNVIPVSTESVSFEFDYEVPDSIKSLPTKFEIKAVGSDQKEYSNIITVEPCEPVGTSDVTHSNSLFLPNPVINRNTLHLGPQHEEIKVYNIFGKFLTTIAKEESSWIVNVPPGTYLLKEKDSIKPNILVVLE